MRYDMNINKIRKMITNLEFEMTKTADVDTIAYLEDMINIYKDMLGSVTRNIHIDTIKNTVSSTSYCFLIEDLSDLSIKPLVELLIDSFTLIKDFPFDDIYDIRIHETNDRLVELTNEFMLKYLPKEYYDKYQKMIASDNFNLCINYEKDSDSCGHTAIDGVNKEKFVIVQRNNIDIDTITLPHEMFHSLFNDYTSYQINANNLVYTREIEGTFANLLFIDFMKSRNNNIATNLDKQLLLFFQIRGLVLMYCAYIINKEDKENILDLNKYRNLFSKCKIDLIDQMDIIELIRNENSEDLISYNIAQLAATDLLYIYKNDPELAFYLLSNLRSYRTDDDIIANFRKNNLTFMDDGFHNFKEYIKQYKR